MNIWVINLNRRPDRWQQTQQKYGQLTIPKEQEKQLVAPDLQRFPAIDGKELVLNPTYGHLLRQNQYQARRSILGTALSHYYLCQQLIHEPTPTAQLILEDDLDYCPQFHRKWAETKQLLQKIGHDQYDVCFVGYCLFPQAEKNPAYTAPNGLVKISNMTQHPYYSGIFGYVLTKRGAEKLDQIIQKKGIYTAFDTIILHAMRGVHRQTTGPFTALCTIPRLVYTQVADLKNKVDSDIQRDSISIKTDWRFLVLDEASLAICPLLKDLGAPLSEDYLSEPDRAQYLIGTLAQLSALVPYRQKYHIPILVWLPSEPTIKAIKTLVDRPELLILSSDLSISKLEDFKCIQYQLAVDETIGSKKVQALLLQQYIKFHH